MSEVSILIKAVDEATAVLKSVKSELGGLDEAGKKAGSETGGLSNLNAKMAALGANLTSVGQNLSTFATVPLVAAGAGFIKLASDAQETSSKFDAVFKDMATDVRAWATEQAGNLNRSSIAWEGYLGNIQDTLVPLGFARDDAADFSKQIVLLSEDLASFNNLRTEDVLRAIQSGVVGNTENFRQFGVVVTQATLDQELLNMGIDGGVKAATEQEKALARMNILMAQTSDAQGDAAKTADSFANLVKGLQAAMQSLGVELGTRLLPLASDFIIRLTNIVTWFNSLPDPVGNVILVLGGLLAAAGPVLIIVGQIITAVGALTPLLPALGAAFAALTGPIGLIVAAVAGLALAFTTDFMGIRTETIKFASGFKDEFKSIGDAVVKVWNESIKPILTAFKDAVVTMWANFIKPTLDVILPYWVGVFNGLKIFIEGWLSAFKNMILAFGELLQGDFSGFATLMFQAGKDLVQGLLNGIGALWTNAKDTVTNLGNNVIGWFKSAVQSQSPSKKMIQEGKNLLEGLLLGLQDPALRGEIQAEIDLLGTQLFALNMVASGGLSPVGMTPLRPSIGGSNASPSNGISGGTSGLATSLTNPPPLGSPNAVLPSLPVLDVALADMTESVENLTTVVTSLSTAPELASPSAMLPSIPKLNTSLENMGFSLDENEQVLMRLSEAQNTNLDITNQIIVAQGSTLETIEATQQTFSSFSDFVATQFGALGTGLLNLGNQIPFFGAAFNAGLQEITNQAGETIGFMFDPIAALTSIFFDLVGQSKLFSELIRIINVLMQPLISVFDLLTPVITGVALVFATVYNALIDFANIITLGIASRLGLLPDKIDIAELLGIGNIEGGAPNGVTPQIPAIETPTATPRTSTFQQPAQFDIGRLPTAVQFAVFTPLVETLDKLSIVVERLVDEGIKVQLQSNSSSATQRFRAA